MRKTRSRTHRPRLSPWWPGAFIAAATLVIVALTSAQSTAETQPQKPGREPGLPAVPCVPVSTFSCFFGEGQHDLLDWITAAQSGVAGARSAKQWARVPISVAAVNYFVIYGDEGDPTSSDYASTFDTRIKAFFVSPSGSQRNYGDTQLIRVRSVAFGSIPVTITLQLQQRRDSANLPLPISIRAYDTKRSIYNPPRIRETRTLYPATIDDRFTVAVKALKVDGVDVGLRECSTPPSAHLDVKSDQRAYVLEYDTSESPPPLEATFDPSDPKAGYLGVFGGTMTGTFDIPDFANCTTRSGDDMARLISSVVSGNDNPVSVRIGSVCASSVYPNPDDPDNPLPLSLLPKPGQDSLKKIPYCPVTEAEGYEYPYGNSKLERSPAEIPIPSRAP